MRKFPAESFLVFLLLSLSLVSFSQDILYKKGTGQVNVNILSFDGNIVQYMIPGETIADTYYVGKSELDSLNYQGKSTVFEAPVIKLEKPMIRNYLITDFVNDFSDKLNIDYEWITKSCRTSFTAGLLINSRKDTKYFWDESQGIFNYASYEPYYYFIRTGVNFYPYNHSLVRKRHLFSTGIALLVGSHRALEYDQYYYYPKLKHEFASSLMWNARERIFLGDHFQINAGLEVSLIPFLVFFCPQAGISIGF